MKCLCKKTYDTLMGKFIKGETYPFDRMTSTLFGIPMVRVLGERTFNFLDDQFDELFDIIDDETWEDITDAYEM